jgi:putative polymerase
VLLDHVLASRSRIQRSHIGKATTTMTGRARLACGIVFVAVTFNMVLCFLNTHVLAIDVSYVIASETIILGLAAVVSFRLLNTETLIVLLLFVAYVCAIWIMTETPNLRTVRTFLIPAVFFALGCTSAKPEEADRLLYLLLTLVLSMGLFELLFLDSFLKVFDVLSYYVSKGGVDDEQAQTAATNLYVSGLRVDDGHQSLGFLGLHRISSIFLEPVSAGNFTAISFIWLWLRREKRPLNMLFLGICALLIVMSDNRFAAFSCVILVVTNAMPILRLKIVIFAMPFVFALVLMFAGSIYGPSYVDNSFLGRLVISGLELQSFDISDWFGDFGTKVGLEYADAGYAYVVNRFGIVGCVALWACFSASALRTEEAIRLKTLVAIYVCLSLSIGEALFSIKTSALLWFLYGASQMVPRKSHVASRSGERAQWEVRTEAV